MDDDESTTFSDEFSEFEHAFSNTPVVYKSVTSESGRRYDDAVLAVQTRKVRAGPVARRRTSGSNAAPRPSPLRSAAAAHHHAISTSPPLFTNR